MIDSEMDALRRKQEHENAPAFQDKSPEMVASMVVGRIRDKLDTSVEELVGLGKTPEEVSLIMASVLRLLQEQSGNIVQDAMFMAQQDIASRNG